MNPSINNRSPRRYVVYFLFWTGLGLFFTVQSVLSYTNQGRPARWDAPLVWQLGYWYTWALLAPLLFRLARKFPLDRGRWRTSIPPLLGATLVVAPFQVAISSVVRAFGMRWAGIIDAEQTRQRLSQIPDNLLTGSFDAVLTFWVILGVFYTLEYYRELRQKEVATSKLQAELAEAQLSNLRAQIQPHFLFNTLNSISALVTDDPRRAERMIARLSDLLRMALDAGRHQFVVIRDEVRLAELYLEIERVRFQDRLDIWVDVHPDVLDAFVPALILQPLVENAVKHGVAPYEQQGSVGIRIEPSDDDLILEVIDSGPGFDSGPDRAPAAEPHGIGLNNTRRRLNKLYGSDWSLGTRREQGRSVVRVTLPVRKSDRDGWTVAGRTDD